MTGKLKWEKSNKARSASRPAPYSAFDELPPVGSTSDKIRVSQRLGSGRTIAKKPTIAEASSNLPLRKSVRIQCEALISESGAKLTNEKKAKLIQNIRKQLKQLCADNVAAAYDKEIEKFSTIVRAAASDLRLAKQLEGSKKR